MEERNRGWLSKLSVTEKYKKKELSKMEVVDLVKNGMTVGELIEKLEQFDKDLVVINDETEKGIPITAVQKFTVDYAIDDNGKEYYYTEAVFIS